MIGWKMDSLGPWTIEEEGSGRFQYVLLQLLPRIPLREDILGQAFRAISPVGLLDDFEYQLIHIDHITCVDRSTSAEDSQRTIVETALAAEVSSLFGLHFLESCCDQVRSTEDALD